MYNIYMKKILKPLLLIFAISLLLIASGCDGNENIYFYFVDTVIDMNVGDSLDLTTLETISNVDYNELNIVVEGGLSINNFVISATSKGTAFVYVCNSKESLAKLQVNIYESVGSNNQPPNNNDNDGEQQNPSSIDYMYDLFQTAEFDYYTLEIKKNGESFDTFTYNVDNSNIEITKSFYVLNISAPKNTIFTLTIRDSVDFAYIEITFPLQ